MTPRKIIRISPYNSANLTGNALLSGTLYVVVGIPKAMPLAKVTPLETIRLRVLNNLWASYLGGLLYGSSFIFEDICNGRYSRCCNYIGRAGLRTREAYVDNGYIMAARFRGSG